VRYEIDGGISPIWLCHCSKCRRATGSAFHASAVCRPDQFRWLQGEDAIAEYADTPRYTTRFCRSCGSPVPSFLADLDLMFLHAGGLDDDPGREIVHHIFVGSKAPWYEIRDECPQYQEHKPVEG
jgi:hypothetical protein